MKTIKEQILKINKITIANLNQAELNEIKAGTKMYDPCYENSYTVYYCDNIHTEGSRNDADTVAVNFAEAVFDIEKH